MLVSGIERSAGTLVNNKLGPLIQFIESDDFGAMCVSAEEFKGAKLLLVVRVLAGQSIT